MSRGTTVDDVDSAPQQSPGQTHADSTHAAPRHHLVEPNLLLQPLVMQFSVILQVGVFTFYCYVKSRLCI